MVALRLPKQHDELLTLPISSVDAWEHAVSVVYRAATTHTLPTRRLGDIRRKELAKKLFLVPPERGIYAEDVALTYRNDAAVGIAVHPAAVGGGGGGGGGASSELKRLSNKIDLFESFLQDQLAERGAARGAQEPMDAATTPTLPLPTQQVPNFTQYVDTVSLPRPMPIDTAVFTPAEVTGIKAKQVCEVFCFLD